MNTQKRVHKSGAPINNGLHDLVEAKREWSGDTSLPNIATPHLGWHQRGYLPHRDKPGLCQFITIRLADAVSLRCLRGRAQNRDPDSKADRIAELEEFLDRSEGVCHLKIPAVATLVENAFWHFEGDRYDLHAWVVMPNHAHVLFTPNKANLSSILESWKKHTARAANRFLGREGRFWQADYWDTYMRDEEHKTETIAYIESNPSRAGLVLNPKAWPWSSARFRDGYGRLILKLGDHSCDPSSGVGNGPTTSP